MKKILLLFLLLFLGCEHQPIEYAPLKFQTGQKVKMRVNNQPAIITGPRQNTDGNEYYITYADNLGELHYARVEEYELDKLEEQ